MFNIKIIDVSYSQKEIDFEAVKKDGVDAVYIRASQGHTITDDKFKEYHDGFKAVGILVGAYHFFMFDNMPAQQAQNFLNAINGREGDLIPMVDCEEGSLANGSSTIGDRIQWLHTFNAYLLEHFPSPCHNLLIYTSLDFWNTAMEGIGAFAGHPLFIAEYNNDSSPEIPRGFTDWVLWQHTDKGSVSGIKGYVDLSYYNGTDLGKIKRI